MFVVIRRWLYYFLVRRRRRRRPFANQRRRCIAVDRKTYVYKNINKSFRVLIVLVGKKKFSFFFVLVSFIIQVDFLSSARVKVVKKFSVVRKCIC